MTGEFIPRDLDQRISMSPDAMHTSMVRLILGEPLADEARLTAFAQELAIPEPLDPWQATQQFVSCFPGNEELFTSDQGLLRPCQGTEHLSAVLGGFENYAHLVGHDTDALIVFRLGLSFQDSGKGLCNAITGSSRGQGKYNERVTWNGVRNLEIADHIKTAIYLLNSQDFLGTLLKAPAEKSESVLQQLRDGPLAALREAWPEGFDVPLDDFLLLFYLCDAGAHTRYSALTNAQTGDEEWAVLPDDHQLTHLFERKYPGGPLILAQPARRAVAALLPGTRYTSHLLDLPEANPFVDQAAYMAEVTKYIFLRHPQRIEEDPRQGPFIRLSPAWNAPADVTEIRVYQGTEEQPDRPPRIPFPHATVVSESDTTRRFAHYYLRGGRIWVLHDAPQSIDPAYRHFDRLRAMQNDYEGHFVRQMSGVLEYARQAARIKYGEPLTTEAAEAFLQWYENSEPPAQD